MYELKFTFEDSPGSNELAHYGVLGMKWGVRKDGKPQGFQYGDHVKIAGRRAKTNIERTRANRNRSQLSETELDKRIARLRKERELRQLTESEVSPGRTYVKEFLKNNGGKLASAVVLGLGAYAIKTYMSTAGLQGPKIGLKEKMVNWDWAEAANAIKLPKNK